MKRSTFGYALLVFGLCIPCTGLAAAEHTSMTGAAAASAQALVRLAQASSAPVRAPEARQAPAQPLPAYTGPGQCLLQVEGRKYLEGQCQIEQSRTQLKIMPAGRRLTYFATILIDEAEASRGYWNEERGANHAHSDLGELNRQGNCWVNATARVCATPARR